MKILKWRKCVFFHFFPENALSETLSTNPNIRWSPLLIRTIVCISFHPKVHMVILRHSCSLWCLIYIFHIFESFGITFYVLICRLKSERAQIREGAYPTPSQTAQAQSHGDPRESHAWSEVTDSKVTHDPRETMVLNVGDRSIDDRWHKSKPNKSMVITLMTDQSMTDDKLNSMNVGASSDGEDNSMTYMNTYLRFR